jgi:hypothetical protein
MKHLPKIIIEIVPLSKIPIKDDVCDYRFDKKGVFRVKIAKTINPDFEMEMLIHELQEWYLNEKQGITIEDVDKWDKEHIGHPGKGSIKGCPYNRNHLFAEKSGKLFIEKCGHDWPKYKRAIEGKNYRKLFE